MYPKNNQISAEIIADSKNLHGDRITTMKLVFPRMVLAEFNTHRMLSKNSASSRAIPFKRMLRMVTESPFIPIRWMKEHTGMQGMDYFTDEEANALHLLENHLAARDMVIELAEMLHKKGVTKQLTNRYLEPLMMHTVLCTGTEWENFFALRADGAAEIHIADLAHKMLDAYNASEPKLLQPGEWHIPYGDRFDEERLGDLIADRYAYDNSPATPPNVTQLYKVKIATARCARTSYLNYEGKDDYNEDIRLHDRLLTGSPLHASPAEHCAKAMSDFEYENHEKTYVNAEGQVVTEYGWCRNMKGFRQYRSFLSNDTAKDSRVISK